MTARKPKPVRAWCHTEKGKLDVKGVGIRPWKRVSCTKCVRVTIVPDGTPSQDAEVRRLRRLLRNVWRELNVSGFETDNVLADRIDAALRGRRGR